MAQHELKSTKLCAEDVPKLNSLLEKGFAICDIAKNGKRIFNIYKYRITSNKRPPSFKRPLMNASLF